MFDIGWQEFILIALVAVVVVGPKDLPRVIRTVGQWIRKARSLASEFQGSLEEMAREAELDDVRKQLQQVSKEGLGASIEKHVDPTGEIRQSIESAKASSGADEIETALDQARRDVNAVANDATTGVDAVAGEARGGYDALAAQSRIPDNSVVPPPAEIGPAGAGSSADRAAEPATIPTATPPTATPSTDKPTTAAEPGQPDRKPSATGEA